MERIKNILFKLKYTLIESFDDFYYKKFLRLYSKYFKISEYNYNAEIIKIIQTEGPMFEHEIASFINKDKPPYISPSVKDLRNKCLLYTVSGKLTLCENIFIETVDNMQYITDPINKKTYFIEDKLYKNKEILCMVLDNGVSVLPSNMIEKINILKTDMIYIALTNKEFIENLSKHEAKVVKKIIEIYLKTYNRDFEIFRYIEFLHTKFPNIFDDDFLLRLYKKSKGRLDYFLSPETYTEEYTMKLLTYRESIKNEINLLDFLDMSKNAPHIKNPKYCDIIKNKYITYFYLLEDINDLGLIDNIFKNQKVDEKTINLKKIRNIKSENITEETLIYLIKNLSKIEKFKCINYLLTERNYPITTNINQVIKRLILEENIDYFSCNLKFVGIDLNEDTKELFNRCPILYLYIKNIFKNETKLLKALNACLNIYFKKEEDSDFFIWNISESKIDTIKDLIVLNIVNNESILKTFKNKIEILKKLMLFDPSIFTMFHFKEKYSLEFINYLYDYMVYIQDFRIDIGVDFTFFQLMEYTITEEIKNDELNTEDYSLISNISKNPNRPNPNYLQIYLKSESPNIKSKLKIIKNYPQILKEMTPSSIFEEYIFIDELKETPEIAKYISDEIKIKYPEAFLNLIKNDYTYVRYLPKDIFNEEYILSILHENKKALLDILIKIKGIKNFNTLFLSENIMNEYLRSEDDKYLYFLDEEYLEQLMILDKLKLDEIKDKNTRKKINKVKRNIEAFI